MRFAEGQEWSLLEKVLPATLVVEGGVSVLRLGLGSTVAAIAG